MTKYVIGEGGYEGITPGIAYEVHADAIVEYIIDDALLCQARIFSDWKTVHSPEKSDAELLAKITARNPDWDLPEGPDRAEEVMREWISEWGVKNLGQSTRSRDFGLFIARKLLKEGVIK